jgi:hypothetical protein
MNLDISIQLENPDLVAICNFLFKYLLGKNLLSMLKRNVEIAYISSDFTARFELYRNSLCQ